MMQILFDGKPATIDGGFISFQSADWAWMEPMINDDVRVYADTHLGYWPDLSEVAILLLRRLGAVEILSSEPVENMPGTIY